MMTTVGLPSTLKAMEDPDMAAVEAVRVYSRPIDFQVLMHFDIFLLVWLL
jgi:hypothetical protein